MEERQKLIGTEVCFVSSEPAPEQYDGFTFFWKAPKLEKFDTELDGIFVLPDGKEQVNMADVVLPEGTDVRTDVGDGHPLGDPRMYQGQRIRVIFRSRNGRFRFPSTGRFSFAFRKSTEEGKIDWGTPFLEMAAEVEYVK